MGIPLNENFGTEYYLNPRFFPYCVATVIGIASVIRFSSELVHEKLKKSGVVFRPKLSIQEIEEDKRKAKEQREEAIKGVLVFSVLLVALYIVPLFVLIIIATILLRISFYLRIPSNFSLTLSFDKYHNLKIDIGIFISIVILCIIYDSFFGVF